MTKFACIGGFLGAGKTTAIIQAARTLIGRGFNVGIITNDQGHELVDTALVRSKGLQAEEIGGGCFCCRFSEFAENAQRLAERSGAQVILAEAVGSCTDLAATVCRRLRQFHSAQFSVAPLTVMVDPHRVREMLADRSPFIEEVRYLFGKQLAEADQVVLTKADMLEAQAVSALRADIQQFVGDIPVNVISAKTDMGVAEWVDTILTGQPGAHQVEIDYQIYGAAEASLGWLNANFDLSSATEFDTMQLGEALITEIQGACLRAAIPVAHVKIMLVTSEGSSWIALTGSEQKPEWGDNHYLPHSRAVSLIINARVCAAPGHLKAIVQGAVKQASSSRGITASICYIEAFSPLPPTPPVFASAVSEN